MSGLNQTLSKALLLCFLVFGFAAQSLAQAPQGINYQAVAREADGTPLADTALDVQISIAADANLNAIDYTEVHSVVTNRFGLFTIIIGEGAPTDGLFGDIEWSTGNKFLNVEIGSLDMGTTQLMSVPYALYAESSGTISLIDSTKFDTATNNLIIYNNGDSTVTDLSSLSAGATSIDTVSFDNDSILTIVEGGDTFELDLSALRNEVNLDNDSTNELIDSLYISGDTLFIEEGNGNIKSAALGSILGDDTLQGFELFGDTLRITDGDGTPFDLDISSLATDAELSDSVTFLIDSIGQVAFNLDTHILADEDVDSLNERINSMSLSGDTLYIDEGNGNIVEQYIGGIIPADSLESFELIGDTLLRITDGDGVPYDLAISSLTTDSELADEVAFLNDSINQVALDLANDVNFLLNELADDSTYLNDSIDQVAADLAAYISSNIDTVSAINFYGDSLLTVLSGDGDSVEVSLGNLATDLELANEVTFLNDSIDTVAANLITEVNFLLNELADDSTYLNDSIDQVAADLAAYISSNIDTVSAINFYGDSLLTVLSGDGDSVEVSLGNLATDLELANEVTFLNDSIDTVAANLITEVNFLLNELADDSTYLNDSIDQVAADLAAYISSNIDTVSAINFYGDSLLTVLSGDGDSVEVSLGNLATDLELANEVTFLNDSIDTVAANLITEVNFLLNELADDSTYLNDSIDQVAADLAAYISSNIDTVSAINFYGDSLLTVLSGDGDSVEVSLGNLATDLELANEVTFLNDSIDTVAANLITEVNFLLNELADDSTYLNDSIDQVAADLAAFVAGSIDTVSAINFYGDSLLTVLSGDGDSVEVSLGALATDVELANEVAFLNDSIDTVAANLITEVNFLLNELADDSTYLNDSIDQVAADLAAFISGSIDTVSAINFYGDSLLTVLSGDGDSVEVSLSDLATDLELANEVAFLNDSIDAVAANLNTHLLIDADVDSTNELIAQLFESGDSLYIIEAGDTFAIDLSGLSPDTLDRIVLNDSNLVVMQTGQVFVNFNGYDNLTISSKGLKYQNLNDIFIGNFLTGQQDDSLYVENIGIGAQALQEAINVPRNTAIGARSFQSLFTGGSNTGVGRWSGVDFENGSDNVMLGNFAGGAIINGNQNVFLGSDINGTNFGTIQNISGGVRIGYQSGNLDSADNRLFIDNSSSNSPLIWGDFSNDILQIGGTFKTNNLTGDTLTYPTADGDSGWVMTTNGNGQVDFTDPASLVDGDTLGNHEMSQNLKTNGFYLSHDGDNEGILIDTAGRVAINTAIDTNYQLRVNGGSRTQGEVFVQNYNYGIITTYQNPGSETQYARLRGHSGGALYRAELALVKDGSRSVSLYSPSGVTDTSELVATGDLFLRTNGNSGTPVLTLTDNQKVGIGTSQPISTLDISSTSFLNTTLQGSNLSGTWLNLANTSAGGRYYQLISTGSSNAVGPGKLLFSFGDTNNLAQGTAMVIDSNKVGISEDNPQYSLDVGDTANIQTLQVNGNYIFPSAAPTQAGQVISYDGTNLIWDTLATSSSEKYGLDSVLTFVSNANNDSILNLGYLTLGTSIPAARIDVVDNTEEFSINVTNSTNSASDKKGVFSTVTGGGSGDNYGVYGESNAATGDKFGVYGGALGAGGIKYGIYGNAQGAGTNYAGYFDNGDVYIDGNLGIGDLGPVRRLDITGDVGADSVFTNELTINGLLFPDAGVATAGQVLSYDGTQMVWDSVASNNDSIWVRNGNSIESVNPFSDSLVLGATDAQYLLDVYGQAFIDTIFGLNSDIDSMVGITLDVSRVGADSIGIGTSSPTVPLDVVGEGYIDSLTVAGNLDVFGDYFGFGDVSVIGGMDAVGPISTIDTMYTEAIRVGDFTGPTPWVLDGSTPASNGDVLTYQNGIGTWASPSSSDDGDWDTTATTVYNEFDSVGIGTTTPSSRFTVATQDTVSATFISGGSLNQNSNTVLISNQGSGNGVKNGLVSISDRLNTDQNVGAIIRADSANNNYGLIVNGGNVLQAGNTYSSGIFSNAFSQNGYAVGIRKIAYSQTGKAIGDSTYAQSINGISYGVMARSNSINDSSVALYASAQSNFGEKFAGYFDRGDVFIRDTLEVDSILKYAHSTVQQGYYLRTNADGTVYADTLSGSTCPAGFTPVNENFCIETAARTTETEWFEAADTCSSLGANLPTWMEWYTGTKEVVSVDYNTTQAWEWLDQASQNNASIVGGGAGATLEDRRKTVSADNPISPSNSVQYRCVYRLK